MEKQTIIKYSNIEDLTNAVANIVKSIDKKSIIVALEGELGSGKTTFVKNYLNGYNVKDTVISPTFILHREYHGTYDNKPVLINHIDFYRLESENELDELRIKNITANSLTFIEWADKFKDYLLSLKNENLVIIWIKFNYIDENTREVRIEIL